MLGLESIDTCAPVFTLLLRGTRPTKRVEFLGHETIHNAVPNEQDGAALDKSDKLERSSLGAYSRHPD